MTAREPSTRKLILVVEDEPAIRRLVQTALDREGVRVISAANGEEALALAADPDLSIDLLLTDLVMPGMSGIELAEDLRHQNPTLRIAYMSGYAENPEALAASRANVPAAETLFIAKPFAAEVLVSRILELLSDDS